MARVEIPFAVQRADGSAVNGATIHVYARGTTTHVDAYNAEVGGALISQPFTTSTSGRIEAWVDENQSVDIRVSGAGISTYTLPFEAIRGDTLADVMVIAGIPPSIVDVKGDLIVATAADTPVRKAVGADGRYLKTASGQADGLTWANIVQGDITNLTADIAAINADVTALENSINALIGINIPIGTIVDFAGSSIPSGYLKCDGAAVSRTTYAGLFAVIDVTYGPGNGSTTFNVPDSRGRTTISPSGSSGRVLTNNTIAATGGVSTVTLNAGQSGSTAHVHTATAASHNHTGATGTAGAHTHNVQVAGVNKTVSGTNNAATGSAATSIVSGTGLTGASAGDHSHTVASATPAITVTAHAGATAQNAHENMQPYIVTNKIIKV